MSVLYSSIIHMRRTSWSFKMRWPMWIANTANWLQRHSRAYNRRFWSIWKFRLLLMWLYKPAHNLPTRTHRRIDWRSSQDSHRYRSRTLRKDDLCDTTSRRTLRLQSIHRWSSWYLVEGSPTWKLEYWTWYASSIRWSADRNEPCSFLEIPCAACPSQSNIVTLDYQTRFDIESNYDWRTRNMDSCVFIPENPY